MSAMPEPEFFFYFILSCFFSAMLYNELRKAFAKKDNSVGPQPFIVALEQKFAPLDDHRSLVKKVDENHIEMRQCVASLDKERRSSVSKVYEKTEIMVEGLRKEMREDIGGLHARLNDIVDGLAEMRGELKHMNNKQP